MEDNKEYYAFISYKREDEKWAKWLQDKLEHYKFPTNLNGCSDLSKNIRPTFRDVTDPEPGLLAEKIDTALRNSGKYRKYKCNMCIVQQTNFVLVK